jgi:isopentenyldiphosphate isomerase
VTRPVDEEVFDLVDEAGRVVGQATRSRCHRDPALLHRAVHLFVFESGEGPGGPKGRGRVFLQRRAAWKDIQPGKWDTSVGGHLNRGESFEQALRREMKEELGLDPRLPVELLHEYLWRSPVESELVRTYRCVSSGPFQLQASEIDAGAFFTVEELRGLAAEGKLTPNLEHELHRLGLLPASPRVFPGSTKI